MKPDATHGRAWRLLVRAFGARYVQGAVRFEQRFFANGNFRTAVAHGARSIRKGRRKDPWEAA